MSKFKQEVKQTEYIIVLYNAINILYEHYKGTVDDKTRHILTSCLNDLETVYYKDYFDNIDIVSNDIIERVVYNDKLREVRPQDFKRVSYCQLLELMDSGLIPFRIDLCKDNTMATYYFNKEENNYILDEKNKNNKSIDTDVYKKNLKESLTDMECIENNIVIIDTH